MKKWLAGVALAGVVLGANVVCGATWYVNSANGSPGDGLSWGAAFTDTRDAVDALAATNATDGELGGHLVLVTNGPYSVGAPTHQFYGTHSGANGSPNVFRALGQVIVRSGDTGEGAFYFDGSSGDHCTDITVDGFQVLPAGRDSASTWDGFEINDYCDRITVANCIVAANNVSDDRPSFQIYRYCTDVTISNCIAYAGADGAGFEMETYYSQRCSFINCIAVGCKFYGFKLYNIGQSSDCRVLNCLTYGNAFGGIGVWSSTVNRFTPPVAVYTTHDEVSADITVECWGITNCIAKNPGFADLPNEWNFNAFYANSPAKNAAEDGGWLGPFQNPVEVPVSAETWYVKTDGNDAASGTSWADAWQTISTATATSGPGDTVTVAAGTYDEAAVITNGGSGDLGVVYRADGNVLIQNASGVVTLDRVVDVTLDGFSINGTGQFGLRLDYSCENTLTNLDIQANWSCMEEIHSPNNIYVDVDAHDSANNNGFNGDAYGPGGNLFKRCRFYNNAQEGVHSGGLGDRFDECEFFNNGTKGSYSGIYANNCREDGFGLFLYNCAIYGNSLHGAEAYNGQIQLYNCTVYGNGENGCHSDSYAAYGDYILYNSIVANNGGWGAYEDNQENRLTTDSDWYVKNTLFWNNGSNVGETTNHFYETTSSGAGGVWTTNRYGTADDIENLTQPAGSCANVAIAEPLFADTASDDYRLKPGSPCIDAGASALITGLDAEYGAARTLTVDLLGNPRTKGTAPDIGAYEWQPWAGTIMLIR